MIKTILTEKKINHDLFERFLTSMPFKFKPVKINKTFQLCLIHITIILSFAQNKRTPFV